MANITGTAGNDILTGTSTDDTMFGLEGGDTLSSLAGNDVVTGGAGTDTLIVNYAAAATDVTMARPTASGPSLVSSPPGGVSVSTTGLLVASQGVEASYTGFDASQYQKLWWGPTVGAALDGQIDSPTETLTLESINGNVATWTGQTALASDGGPRARSRGYGRRARRGSMTEGRCGLRLTASQVRDFPR